jgi:hypothetical protein
LQEVPMLELATLAANFVAFALLHGAEPRRRPERLRAASPMWRHVCRFLAVALVSYSVGAWARVEGLSAAILVVMTMFSAAATVFALAVTVYPRLSWGAALVGAASVPCLSWLGGSVG